MPFEGQLRWKSGKADETLIPANRVFIKHGYLPPPTAIEYLRGLRMDRILVCGVQADTCVLAAGFALFDAGLHPTLLKWLTVGSSLDRSGNLGARLLEHHFGSVLKYSDQLGLPEFANSSRRHKSSMRTPQGCLHNFSYNRLVEQLDRQVKGKIAFHCCGSRVRKRHLCRSLP
jgi:hypothetical protein